MVGIKVKGAGRLLSDALIACAATLRAGALAAVEHWPYSIGVLAVFVLLAVFTAVPFAFFALAFLVLAFAKVNGRVPLIGGIAILVLCFLLALFGAGSSVMPVVILAYALLSLGVLLQLVRLLLDRTGATT